MMAVDGESDMCSLSKNFAAVQTNLCGNNKL